MGERPETLHEGVDESWRPSPAPDAVTAASSRPFRMLAAALVVGGSVGALIAATSVAQSDADTSRATFVTSSGAVASTLQLAIESEDALLVHASGFVLDHPESSNAEWVQWLTSRRVFERHPDLERIGLLVTLTPAQLPAFTIRATNDPSGPLEPDGTFQVIPPGDRPLHCFVAVQQALPDEVQIPAGYDFCADPAISKIVVTARDTGQGSYLPTLEELGKSGLIVQVPIYSGGTVPLTVAARRDAFVGLLGVQVGSSNVLDRALHGHDDLAVTLRFEDEYSEAQFSSGTMPEEWQSATFDLENGWTVETFGTASSDRVVDNRTALMLLGAGIALSALAAIGLVLATGRARALRLVAERTGELRHQALHDALTGLPNRALIMDRIEQLLARNRRLGTSGAALYIDLDDFKSVNDTLGHQAGDQLLVAVAARIAGELRDADTVGRMGGDEFVVLIDGATTDVAPERVAERLLQAMRHAFVLDGATMPIIVSASIGIAIGDRCTAGNLLRDADVALYRAKAAGRNRYEIFHADMQSEILQRVELEFELRSALNSDQFHLVYQPIYNLENLSLVGVEALLRWQHPTLGLIEPDRFIPILEQTGQIHDVGRWVLDEACQQMATWHASGDTLDISVNVSGRQLDGDDIVDDVRRSLADSGLDPAALIIEITETALMRNTNDTARRLHAIKALGVRIAVDDFGTGYSSLAYLQQFPVDCLKIDRTFTSAITTSAEARALIGTLVQLGKDLGLKTLAEGVETTVEIDHLRSKHVDEVQGFLLARPLDPTTLEALILVPARARQPATSATTAPGSASHK
ncbi:MAG TPA: bifunctional diguanylate cyclase/phosphodiesterase [Ilumatobacter sp.]|nr:bifunctional diguanylate cyclase/phosphodiesterase [Ilumatobacter sp.]